MGREWAAVGLGCLNGVRWGPEACFGSEDVNAGYSGARDAARDTRCPTPEARLFRKGLASSP
jgi:hypothetical protein